MISIIIPVYNIKPYISQCLESVLVQTYRNWELILIDDGSNDGSREVCDEYALKYPIISVLHTPNRGVGAARNLGIDKAKGEWLVFIDGDDIISKDFLESLIRNAITYDSDLTITRYTIHLQQNNESIKHITQPGFYKKSEIGKGFLNQKHPLLYSSCYRLFKTNLIKENKIQFSQDLNLGEDYVFAIQYLSIVQSVLFINEGEYQYLKREGSLSHKKRVFKESLKVFQTIQSTYYDKIKNRYSKEMELFIGREIVDSLEVALLGIYDLENKKEQIKILKNLDLQCYRKYKKCHSWKEWLLKQLLIYKFSKLYLFLRNYSFTKSK